MNHIIKQDNKILLDKTTLIKLLKMLEQAQEKNVKELQYAIFEYNDPTNQLVGPEQQWIVRVGPLVVRVGSGK